MLTIKQMANIRTYLKNNFILPEKGFVAGQAVASLIYKELNLNLNTPINDVDVFDLMESDYKNYIKMKKHEDNLGVLAHNGSNSAQAFCQASRGYEVKLSTYLQEDKKVNLIYISQTHNEKELDKDLLLNSFDFNCCAVGYDIETGAFVWSKSFEDFLKTRQLRVQSVHTPLHTLLRLNKKIEDLGKNVYCDKDVERDLLVSALVYFGDTIRHSQIVGKRFLKLFYRYKDNFITDLIQKVMIPEECRGRPDYRRVNVSAKVLLDYLSNSPISFKPMFKDMEFSEVIYVPRLKKHSIRRIKAIEESQYKSNLDDVNEVALIEHALDLPPLSIYEDDLSRIQDNENKELIKNHFLARYNIQTKRFISNVENNVEYGINMDFGVSEARKNSELKSCSDFLPNGYAYEQKDSFIACKLNHDKAVINCKGSLPELMRSLKITCQSFVHFYHAIKNTGVFDLKYSHSLIEKILEMVDARFAKKKNGNSFYKFKDLIEDMLFFSEYANDISKNTFSKIDLNKKLNKYSLVSKLFEKHNQLSYAMHKMSTKESYLDNIEKLHYIAKKIKKEKRREFVIGLLESEQCTLCEVYNVIDLDFEDMKKVLFELTPEIYKIANDRRVTNGFSLKGFGKSLSLKQLVTPEDFYNAGIESDNCIFGYFKEYVSDKNTMFQGKKLETESQYYRIELNGVVSNMQVIDGIIYQHYNIKNTKISNYQKYIGLLFAYCFVQDKDSKKKAKNNFYLESKRIFYTYVSKKHPEKFDRLMHLTSKISKFLKDRKTKKLVDKNVENTLPF